MEMIEIYKLIGNNSLFDILGTVLSNRNIKNIDKFLKPSASDILSFKLLKNMDLAVNMFKKHQGSKESKATVLVDSDP